MSYFQHISVSPLAGAVGAEVGGVDVSAAPEDAVVAETGEQQETLREFLWAHAHRPEFIGRLAWKPGSVAFWNNRCTQHYAIHDRPDTGRHLRRTQIAG